MGHNLANELSTILLVALSVVQVHSSHPEHRWGNCQSLVPWILHFDAVTWCINLESVVSKCPKKENKTGLFWTLLNFILGYFKMMMANWPFSKWGWNQQPENNPLQPGEHTFQGHISSYPLVWPNWWFVVRFPRASPSYPKNHLSHSWGLISCTETNKTLCCHQTW